MTSALESDLRRCKGALARNRTEREALIGRREWLMERLVRDGKTVLDVAAIAGVNPAVVVRAVKAAER